MDLEVFVFKIAAQNQNGFHSTDFRNKTEHCKSNRCNHTFPEDSKEIARVTSSLTGTNSALVPCRSRVPHRRGVQKVVGTLDPFFLQEFTETVVYLLLLFRVNGSEDFDSFRNCYQLPLSKTNSIGT